jgi:DNA-binding MarR family transcriptional regulator
MTAPDAPEEAVRDAEVRVLSDQLPRFMRVVQAAKTQLSTDTRDRAALVLLFPLVRLGPLRQSALAELVHADPSTVSRHVAGLVDEGLVHRIPDETDGRASRLVVTDAGLAALEALRREREALIGRVTSSWSDGDLTTLTELFTRFIDDLTAALPGLPAPSASPSAPREIP